MAHSGRGAGDLQGTRRNVNGDIRWKALYLLAGGGVSDLRRSNLDPTVLHQPNPPSRALEFHPLALFLVNDHPKHHKIL